MAAETDAAMGTHIPEDACKAWIGQLLNSRPDLKGQLKRWMKSQGVNAGVPVRKRFDFKYARVGLAWDAAGLLQNNDPTALFTGQIGGTDAVLGQLTEQDTNVVTAGKQDSAEMYKAYAMGFVIQLISDGSATIDALARVQRQLLENTSATLTLGTQNRQRFPVLSSLPGLAVGFQTGGGAIPTAVVTAATQGKQSLIRFDPPIYLGAGESYSVELKIKRSLTPANIPLIQQGAGFEDIILAYSCVMYGVSYTGIPG
ncbi:MAG TPA: hypothetical protein ENH78_11515 [Phycisphaerae bacterium]|nr:hypothetical protein [Phycisphaerae bacterium]